MAASLALSSLKHIQSLTFHLAPLATTSGARSLRLLLSSIPATLPSPAKLKGTNAEGLNKLPELRVHTTSSATDARVEVVYSNKKVQELRVGTTSMGVAELTRKVEGPARALQLQSQGV